MDAMNLEITGLAWTGLHMTPWKLIGLSGATLFALRWLVQFVATHHAGEPVIPRAFWVMSLAGSTMTLAYFLCSNKQDAVGVLQNLFPALTAAYSLWLDLRRPRRAIDRRSMVPPSARGDRHCPPPAPASRPQTHSSSGRPVRAPNARPSLSPK